MKVDAAFLLCEHGVAIVVFLAGLLRKNTRGERVDYARVFGVAFAADVLGTAVIAGIISVIVWDFSWLSVARGMVLINGMFAGGAIALTAATAATDGALASWFDDPLGIVYPFILHYGGMFIAGKAEAGHLWGAVVLNAASGFILALAICFVVRRASVAYQTKREAERKADGSHEEVGGKRDE